jgi:hypothetical protein
VGRDRIAGNGIEHRRGRRIFGERTHDRVLAAMSMPSVIAPAAARPFGRPAFLRPTVPKGFRRFTGKRFVSRVARSSHSFWRPPFPETVSSWPGLGCVDQLSKTALSKAGIERTVSPRGRAMLPQQSLPSTKTLRMGEWSRIVSAVGRSLAPSANTLRAA